MTARLPFTQHSLRRAIRAAEAEGLRVKGIRPDGTLLVDRGDSGEKPLDQVDSPPAQPSKWADAKS